MFLPALLQTCTPTQLPIPSFLTQIDKKKSVIFFPSRDRFLGLHDLQLATKITPCPIWLVSIRYFCTLPLSYQSYKDLYLSFYHAPVLGIQL